MDIFGIYHHFKGKDYRVISLAIDIDTGEKYVFYQQLYAPYKFWIRPYSLFFSEKALNGKLVPRFIKVSEDCEPFTINEDNQIQIIHSETSEIYTIESFDGSVYYVKRINQIIDS